MYGRKCFVSILALFVFSCSSNPLMKPDCHSCTAEDQEWDDFAWNDLQGQWKGEVETLKNEKGAVKKEKQQKKVEIRIFTAGEFLKAKGQATCPALPENALVVNGLFWGGEKQEYEAFVPSDEEKVVYGRLAFEKVNGQTVCQFRRLGRVMGKNRLDLPTVTFSENNINSNVGRTLASSLNDSEVNLEFLRFAPTQSKNIAFRADGRRPASVKEEQKPPFILRIFKLQTKEGGERGQWQATEEQIFRLWKVQ
jgi:hypothetical protein